MNFKKALALTLVFACLFTMLLSCGAPQNDSTPPTEESSDEVVETDPPAIEEEIEDQPIIPDVELKNLGENLENAGINSGKFEGDTTNADFTVTYISGTENAYSYDDSKKTLTFSALSADSVYSISGKLNGNIVIDVGENYALSLELANFALRSSSANPILINSGKKVQLSAKANTKNYIYDERAAAASDDAQNHTSAVDSTADLLIEGAGELFIQSIHNDGIQSAKNLTVKNLSLVVECNNGALKGKNSVTLKNCSTLLVAKSGDAIKTEATDLSASANQQNGIVSIFGGTHNIFASNDGIEAAYDVVVDYGSVIDDTTKEEKIVATIINIRTDSYSSYTDPTAHEKPDIETRLLYLCNTSENYKYSVKLSNADGSKSEWINPTFHESIKSGRRTYYTYKFYAKPEYTKMQVFVYSEEQTQQNEETYVSKSNITDFKNDSDTYRFLSNSRGWEWRTYESLSSSGNNNASNNPNAISYSAKGIRAANSITIKAGNINVSATDNAISTKNQVVLDNEKTALGDITIDGGNITVTTKSNGLYSDGTLTVNSGSIKVVESFEGFKANIIKINDGDISVISTGDGLSAIAKSGTGLTIAGGSIYVYAGAYGINASSTSSYTAIAFNGGDTVIIAPATSKSAIYSKGGYSYTEGRILAILNKEGNKDSSTHCYTFSRSGKIQEIDLTENTYAIVGIDDEITVAAKIPSTFSATVIYIGDKYVDVSSSQSIEATENYNGVYWTEQ